MSWRHWDVCVSSSSVRRAVPPAAAAFPPRVTSERCRSWPGEPGFPWSLNSIPFTAARHIPVFVCVHVSGFCAFFFFFAPRLCWISLIIGGPDPERRFTAVTVFSLRKKKKLPPFVSPPPLSSQSFSCPSATHELRLSDAVMYQQRARKKQEHAVHTKTKHSEKYTITHTQRKKTKKTYRPHQLRNKQLLVTNTK